MRQRRNEGNEVLQAAAELEAGQLAGLDPEATRRLGERLSRIGAQLLAGAEQRAGGPGPSEPDDLSPAPSPGQRSLSGRHAGLTRWRVSLQNALGDTPLSAVTIQRLGELLGKGDIVTVGRNGGPAAEMRIEARHSKEAEAIAIETWTNGLRRAGVHVGPITNVLVTTDPTGFTQGVRYESWVPERDSAI